MSDKKNKDEFIWAALLHLGMNMWHDQKAPLKPVRDYLMGNHRVSHLLLLISDTLGLAVFTVKPDLRISHM